MQYSQLIRRANAKGITTFQDIEKINSDAFAYANPYDEGIEPTDELYDCQSVVMELEVLAECGDI